MVVRAVLRSALSAASLAALLSAPGETRAQAKGMPALAWQPAELFTKVGGMQAPAGTSWGNATFHKGHLVLGFDADEDSSGFRFYDISNPRAPRLVHQKYDAESRRLREIQGYSFALGYGRDLVAIPSHAGLEIWDFTDHAAVRRHGAVALARGGGKGIYNGVISAAWQPPYVYCGAMDNGVFVVDARDPQAPRQVKRLENSVIGGRLGGPAFVLGNLLVVTTMEPDPATCAITTFDISNPADPQVVDLYRCSEAVGGSYTAFMAGNRIYGQGVIGYLTVHEILPDFTVRYVGMDPDAKGRGGYGMYQDGYVHAGMSDRYVKYLAGKPVPSEVGRFSLGGDNDWVIPLGNLAFVGDDDGPASEGALVPHQASPDVTGPLVNFSVPAPGAAGLAVGSRVGLSFTDNIDPATVDTAGFQVRPAGGRAVPGRFSVLMGLVNFTPDAPLSARTAYEVVVKAGRLKDWAGNAVPRDTVIPFATGNATSVRARPDPARLRGIRLIAAGLGIPGLPAAPAARRDPLGRSAHRPFPALPAGTADAKARPAAGIYLVPAADR